jgi:N-acetylglucosamine malate deacetylase 1
MQSVTRREALVRAGRLGTGLAGACMLSNADGPSQTISQDRKLKVVVAGGHPGDAEYGCGGTIVRYADLGHEVVLLHLNDGTRPDRGAPPHVRLAEAGKAAEILKARAVFARQLTGHAVQDDAHFDEFRKILEKERPDLVFTQWPIDQHRDHRAISALAFDAWLQMKKKFALFYYEVTDGEDTLQFSPTHYVDITEAEPRKRAACYAYASITPDRFYATQDQVVKFRGVESGHQRAEAYVLQVQSPYIALPASARMPVR